LKLYALKIKRYSTSVLFIVCLPYEGQARQKKGVFDVKRKIPHGAGNTAGDHKEICLLNPFPLYHISAEKSTGE